jgi:hypothetical protein
MTPGAQSQNNDLKGVYEMLARFVKTGAFRAVLLLGGLCGLTLASNAQSTIARATVPFEFAAAGAMMPPGDYTIDIPDFSGVVILHGSSTGSIALLTTFSSAVVPGTAARLVFERRDGMAYLAAVEWPDQSARVMSAYKRIRKDAVASALH